MINGDLKLKVQKCRLSNWPSKQIELYFRKSCTGKKPTYL